MINEEVVDEVLETAKVGAEKVKEYFTDPEDDWIPVLIVGNEDGIEVLGIPPFFMEDGNTKDALAQHFLPMIIKSHNAKAVALVTSAWASSYDEDPRDEEGFMPADRPMPSQDPSAIEILMINALGLEKEVHLHATIYRDGEQPPGLGEWETEYEQLDGRFVNAIRDALADED